MGRVALESPTSGAVAMRDGLLHPGIPHPTPRKNTLNCAHQLRTLETDIERRLTL